MTVRLRAPLGAALLAVVLASPTGVSAQRPVRDTSLVERLFDAEDGRAATPDALRLLLETAARGSGAPRLVAIRAVGRLERPSLADSLMPLLRDTSATVRLTAAHAVGQLLAPIAIGTIDSVAGARLVTDVGARLVQFLQFAEGDAAVRGALATSIGRAAHPSAEARRAVQAVLLRSVDSSRAEAIGALRGLDWLWRGRGLMAAGGDRAAELVAPVERLITATRDSAVRRWALLALVSSRQGSARAVEVAQRDADAQQRRLGLLVAAGLDSAVRTPAVATALRDPSPLVRLEAARVAARQGGEGRCATVGALIADPHPHVAITALDVLPTSCTSWAAALDSVVQAASRSSDGPTLHRAVHALVRLAAIDAARARSALPGIAAHRAWIARVYAARAAGVLRDGATALTLAGDADDNVREAALTALIGMEHPRTDSVAIASLARVDYQLVLTAAEWLRAKGPAAQATPAALTSLERITRERRETSRDPRLALVRLVAKGGSASDASRLTPFARDFDAVIATEAARAVSGWTGRAVTAAPAPMPRPAIRAADAAALTGARLRLTMAPEAGGGVIEIALDPATAPATVLRVVRLARAGHYTGRTFHRVVPTFVIQGGSPGANEYMGDGPYLRDEVGPAVHARGTLGISTRGRDTGDAQLFVNIVDNPRLDFQYTVFGRIVAGLDVADRVLEGDRFVRVEVVRR